MRKITFLLILLIFISCKDEVDCCVNPAPVDITLKFTHNWNGVPVTSSDFNDFKFTTENGESVSLVKLRYVVSDINIGNKNKTHHMINIGEESGLELNFNEVNQGSNILKFTFGFADANNIDGAYQDLNSVSFNVPGMLGGGYHYMQFDGKYKDNNNDDANFNYHAIRAVDKSDPNNLVFKDTSFEFDMGAFNFQNDTTVEVKMNIAEWFKNPNTWDLNILNTVLMPNFETQKLMQENGKTVFSLGDITNN